MKTFVSLLFSLFLLFVPATMCFAVKNVSLAVLNWNPYAGEKLENYGFGAEIISEAFSRSGYTTEFHFMPWMRALKDTEIGKYDAVCFGYYSKQRAKTYAFSEPYAQSSLVLYKHKDSQISYSTLEDLKPYQIGVVRGFVNTVEFDSADYLQKQEVHNEVLNMKKLLNKRVDLIVIDKFIAQYLLNTMFKENKEDFEALEPPLETKPLYLMFSRNVKKFVQKLEDFNLGLQKIESDGTIDIIMEKHGFE